jgi:RNA polymerase sigma factor (sigma-70 family)
VHDLTDEQLIREILDGHIEKFAQLLQRYERKILAYIFHMLKPVQLDSMTEDLCQDTFYKVYRNLSSFRAQHATFSTWIYTIARNTVISELRKQRATAVSLDESLNMADPSVHVLPEQAVLRTEKMSLVRMAISKLSEKQRSALILREYNQLEYQEIADILGQPVSSIKSLLFRARSSVKMQLHEYYGDTVLRKFDEVKRR